MAAVCRVTMSRGEIISCLDLFPLPSPLPGRGVFCVVAARIISWPLLPGPRVTHSQHLGQLQTLDCASSYFGHWAPHQLVNCNKFSDTCFETICKWVTQCNVLNISTLITDGDGAYIISTSRNVLHTARYKI